MATARSEKTDTRKRLESCWSMDLCWDLYPEVLRNVGQHFHVCIMFDKFDYLENPLSKSIEFPI